MPYCCARRKLQGERTSRFGLPTLVLGCVARRDILGAGIHGDETTNCERWQLLVSTKISWSTCPGARRLRGDRCGVLPRSTCPQIVACIRSLSSFLEILSTSSCQDGSDNLLPRFPSRVGNGHIGWPWARYVP